LGFGLKKPASKVNSNTKRCGGGFAEVSNRHEKQKRRTKNAEKGHRLTMTIASPAMARDIHTRGVRSSAADTIGASLRARHGKYGAKVGDETTSYSSEQEMLLPDPACPHNKGTEQRNQAAEDAMRIAHKGLH
jgi:hypothetical protein